MSAARVDGRPRREAAAVAAVRDHAPAFDAAVACPVDGSGEREDRELGASLGAQAGGVR